MRFYRGRAYGAVLLLLMIFCAAQYRIVEWERCVAVEEVQTGEICWRSDVPLALLPSADARKIRGGIACADATAAARAAENFCS